MPEMKKVTLEQYAEKLKEHKTNLCVMELRGWQVPILHGLIAMVADHPGIKKLGPPTKETIVKIRQWCLKVLATWGFTPEELEYLDKIRERPETGEETNPEKPDK